jgi:hypothetical protein
MAHTWSPSLPAIIEESPSEDDSASSVGESASSPLPRVCNTVISIVPIVTMPPSEETPVLQIIPMRPQRTATWRPLPKHLAAHQAEQRCVLQNDIERQAAWKWGELADEWTAVEARPADHHQHDSLLGAGQTVVMEWVEQKLPTFIRATKNVSVVAMVLDTLPTPSTEGVGDMYQRLMTILGTTAA